MEEKNLIVQIFEEIETIEEFNKVCRSIIFLHETVNLTKTPEIYYESNKAFIRLKNL